MAVQLHLKKYVLTFVLVGILALAIPSNVMSQNCGCAPNLCCNKFGFCGEGPDYCGEGCKGGPCTTSPTPSTPTPSGGGSVASICWVQAKAEKEKTDIVTAEFFHGIKDQAAASCAGKTFYTRDAFLNAANSFPDFGKGSADESKREIAAFFAHITHETGYFCYIEAVNGATRDCCDETYTQYPCNPSKGYYGRGPIQLSWNYNYGPAGESIGFDGLNAPETVATDPVISFKTAMWYWAKFVQPVINQGFGATIRALNGQLECDGSNPSSVQTRVDYYRNYCNQLGVSPGNNLTC